MFKSKVLALIAAMTVSMSAQAGFVQYTFDGAKFTDGGTLTGYFIQDTETDVIKYYELAVSGGNMVAFKTQPMSEGANIISAHAGMYGQAATNFKIYTTFASGYDVTLDLSFWDIEMPGRYKAEGHNEQFPQFSPMPNPEMMRMARRLDVGFVNGSAVQDMRILDLLNQGEPIDGMLAINPTRIPEPGSIVLLGLAAAGLYSVRRRKVA